MKRKYLIGERYINNKGLEYEIIDYVENNSSKRIIQFIESGYVTECSTSVIPKGLIRDGSNNYYGVGKMDIPNGGKHILYGRWISMLSRCYNVNDVAYETYGKIGVTVDKRWHTFSNYVKDITKKENYNKLATNSKNWHIDKDILIKGNKVYSNNTTIITDVYSNVYESNKRNNNLHKVVQYTKDGKFINEYESITEASRQCNIRRTDITNCCRGEQKTAKGFVWKYKGV